MKIVLLGYMGSGKTTVGTQLANLLKHQFIDLDAYIEKNEKLSITSIFEDKGELYFRKKEFQYLQEVLVQQDDFVLSVGGGTPCYGKNMDVILQNAEAVVYLNVPIPQLVERLLKEKSQRPLIRSISDEDLPEFIGKHLFERSMFYNRAHSVIYCGHKTPDAIASQILQLVIKS